MGTLQVYRDPSRRYFVSIKEGHKYIHLLTMMREGVEVMKVTSEFINGLALAPPKDTARHCAKVWEQSQQPKSVSAVRAIQAILADQMDGFNPSSLEEVMPKPEKPTKPPKPQRGVDQTTLAQLCRELGFEPILARRVLRKVHPAREGRWAWPTGGELLVEVQQILKRELGK